MNTITLALTDPTDAASLQLQDALSDYLQTLTGSSGRASFDACTLGPRDFFLLARDAGNQPVGCVALREIASGIGEIKRMYARPGTQGVGAQLLRALEDEAQVRGFKQLWLETRKINQRAVDFYLRNGYQIRENYGRYVGKPEAICFGKILPTPVFSGRALTQ
ncbi:GNAT family N-acetyltransferase [Kosakonia sp. BK9b]